MKVKVHLHAIPTVFPTKSLQNPLNRKLGGLALEFVWMLGRIEESLNDNGNQSMVCQFQPI